MSRKEDNSRRRDVRIPHELDKQIQQIARDTFDARIHHISNEPEVTDTIVELIRIGIRYLDAGLRDKLSGKLSDSNVLVSGSNTDKLDEERMRAIAQEVLADAKK